MTPVPRAAAGVASPCINVCRMDPATGWCAGCWRTIDEIAAWSRLDDAARQAVLDRLPARRAQQAAPEEKTAMVDITFYFDPISPYACLAFERLPQVLQGHSYRVDYQPVLLAAMLSHWGQKGPAEIEPKRAWTFRHVGWLAHRHGLVLDTPLRHPFNPLALLRLLIACAPAGRLPGRHACEQVLHHVWHGGADAEDPERLAALAERLQPVRDPASPEVKQALRDLTDGAIARGVFGVPTLAVGDRLYWGLEGLEALGAALGGDAFLTGDGWEGAGAPRAGVRRGG